MTIIVETDRQAEIIASDEPVKVKLRELLKDIHIRVLLKDTRKEMKQEVIFIHHDYSVDRALTTLSMHNILAAPIKDSKSKNLLGILSIHQIISAAFKLRLLPRGASEAQVFKATKEFLEMPIMAIVGNDSSIAIENQPLFTDQDCLFDIINALSLGRNRRALVTERDCTIDSPAGIVPLVSFLHLVSQHDVGSFLYTQCLENPEVNLIARFAAEILEIPIVELTRRKHSLFSPASSPNPAVLCLQKDQPVICAFQIMFDNNINAIPVVDNHGKYVQSVSEEEIAGITRETFDLLNAPPTNRPRSRDTMWETGIVKDAIEIMLFSNLKHVWVLNKDHIVIGCVTWTDVLALFIN